MINANSSTNCHGPPQVRMIHEIKNTTSLSPTSCEIIHQPTSSLACITNQSRDNTQTEKFIVSTMRYHNHR